MSVAQPSEITRLLHRWTAGDARARDELVPLVYDRLRQLARQRRRYTPGDHSLDTTALVHEAYIRLVDVRRVDLRDRASFLALASRVMRNLLVDHARARYAAKRGGGKPPLPLDEALMMSDGQLELIGELDEALQRLERLNPRQSTLLEQYYFGGLSTEEAAQAIGVSVATVKRDLRSARAWLALELRGEPLL
jgi:RNA polymerase sigma factor (TIGR02999 family)